MQAFDRIPVRFRLSLTHSALMAIIYIVLGVALYKMVEKNFNESVDAALGASARFIRDARDAHGGTDPVDTLLDRFFRDSFDAVGVHFIRPYAQIMNISGRIHSRSENIRVNLPITPEAYHRAENGLTTFETFEIAGQAPLRQITLPILLGDKFTGEIIQVGASLSHTRDALTNTAVLLWIILPSTLLISICFGYFLTARALKPVKNITRAAASIGIDDLALRLPEPVANDELRDLSLTFNKLLDRLEEAVGRLRRFTADVSHELRTPLTVLRGEAELALRRERGVGDYQLALGKIADESRRMGSIIEDLLLLARAQSQSVAMNWIDIEVQHFVHELKHQLEPVYSQKNVALSTQIATNVPLKMRCSPAYLALALKHILLNAAKHTPGGKGVLFSVQQQKGNLIFSVADEGEGIDAASLPYIFDPFYRADTARNRALGGVGIGLSLAMALVKLHSGNITVDQEHTHGAKFDVTVPAAV